MKEIRRPPFSIARFVVLFYHFYIFDVYFAQIKILLFGLLYSSSGLQRLFKCCCVYMYLYFNWYKYSCILPSSLSILLFQIGANFFNKKASKANITCVTNIYMHCTVCYHSVPELIQ